MNEVVGVGVLAVSAILPVLVARTVLGIVIAPLRRRPAPAPVVAQPRD